MLLTIDRPVTPKQPSVEQPGPSGVRNSTFSSPSRASGVGSVPDTEAGSTGLSSPSTARRKKFALFQQGLQKDEKTDCLLRTLAGMYSRLPLSSMWQSAPPHLIAYARKTIERVVMAQIHALAFYPNLDADRHRDELSVFCYSQSQIDQILHGEAPWPSAQAEISVINAYKSARDKLACVVRCCETISNLISMAPGTGAAAADDITPVLVYVIIQANPPSLLSNVQYVQGFGGSLLEGAEGYWWTQFTAAIEFVKTLL
ncbi:vacuolar sorting protein 9 domain protein [Ancylostoma duodenale]|uniref:Vacuolar sorting protein 9 domain protein n=1 Tax=Ancylostoma duodenale TaxID=51022 RepID=A0A0C2E114_9BILA|nr:vacuolar sorting protein 9 domain protein [Ancylostoma duodenale]